MPATGRLLRASSSPGTDRGWGRKGAEQAFDSVKSPEIRNEFSFIAWRARTHIHNDKPHLAWEVSRPPADVGPDSHLLQAYLSLDVSSKSYVLLQVSWERAAVRVTVREGDCQHVLLHGSFLLLPQGDAPLSPSSLSLSLSPLLSPSSDSIGLTAYDCFPAVDALRPHLLVGFRRA